MFINSVIILFRMDLEYALNVASDFAKSMVKSGFLYSVDDVGLYGSVIKGTKNLNDIDIFLIHRNPLFEYVESNNHVFDSLSKKEQFTKLNDDLIAQDMPSLYDIFSKTVLHSLESGVLNIKFIPLNIFDSQPVYELNKQQNIDPLFFETIHSYSQLWDAEKESFSKPFKEYYSLIE